MGPLDQKSVASLLHASCLHFNFCVRFAQASFSLFVIVYLTRNAILYFNTILCFVQMLFIFISFHLQSLEPWQHFDARLARV
jgi:hypothetical protein